MAESAVQLVAVPRRLISLTTTSKFNIVIDLNDIVAIEQSPRANDYATIVMSNGKEYKVIEHHTFLLEKWVGDDEVDYSIEGEDTL
ncbi:MAG: hypothetical protein ABS904_00920 [Solibacillus isronensis]